MRVMDVQLAVKVAAGGFAIAVSSAIALVVVLIESEKPDRLPDWVSLAALATLLVVGVGTCRILWRAYHSLAVMLSLALTSFLIFVSIWLTLEVTVV